MAIDLLNNVIGIEIGNSEMQVIILKRKRIIVLVCVLILLCIGVFIMQQDRDDKLFVAVQNHVREHGNSTVPLGKLMDFDWDQALIYNGSVGRADIRNAIGVDFTGRTDLANGIIFLKDDDIIYYEVFPMKGIGVDILPGRVNFSIGRVSLRIFSRDDVFRLSTFERRGKWYYNMFYDLAT